ncbi:MAG TPA: glucose 1-dehydrogenase [Spirochaetes bacterium]|nr:glucose 1-dehydrogenase [Spirochaetota bacterium]
MRNSYKSIFNLEGKTAVVTGSGGGIGRAIACALADFGADVMCTDNNPEEVKKTARLVCEYGPKGIFFVFDISDVEEIKAFKQKTLKELGRVDILVNSAGMNRRDFITDIKEEDFLRILDVNLKGVLFCCQAFGKEMIKQKSGKIINIASISSLLGHPARGSYAASKGGLVQISRVMATEWAPYNVCVNAISPAAIDTPFIGGLKKDPDWLGRELERIPMGRIGAADDIVGAVVFFASKASDFITGTNLFIDGGRTVD